MKISLIVNQVDFGRGIILYTKMVFLAFILTI